MEENKVAPDKELRDLAAKLATDALDLYVNGSRRWQFIKERDELSEVIFRELVLVRDKLAAMRLPEDKQASAYPQLGYKWADAILQSPDLRVTLVEKPQRYQKHIATNRMVPIVRVVDKEIGGYVAEFLGTNADADADAYINSKEPK